MRFIKKILERGTITIPSDVREALDVDEGDIVEFQILRVVKRQGAAPAQPTLPAKPSDPNARSVSAPGEF